MIILLTLSSGLCVSAQENLLKLNADFESGTMKGWSVFGEDKENVSVCSEAASNSKFGLKLSIGETRCKLYSNTRDGVIFKVENGKKYCLEFMIKVITTGGPIQLTVYPVSGFKKESPFVQKNKKTDNLQVGEWTTFKYEFDGVDIPEAKFTLEFVKGECFVDDVKLYELNK